jgi:hypothetical protein
VFLIAAISYVVGMQVTSVAATIKGQESCWENWAAYVAPM